MSKSPAFQFYPDNFVSGAPAFMKPIETHVYMWLLCLEWSRAGFVYNETDLASWCRIPASQFRAAWPKVSESFTERDGRYFNPRLDKEREKQNAYSERMAANGKKGGRPKAVVKPEESRGFSDEKLDESRSEADVKHSVSISNSISKTTTTSDPKVDIVLDCYLSRHPRRRVGPKDRKAVVAALAMGYSPVELVEAIDGNAADPWHKDKHKHELPYVLRDTGKIDDFRGKLEASKPKSVVDPATGLLNLDGLKLISGDR